MTNIEYANGLRAIADLYEKHPEMPRIGGEDVMWVFCNNREEFISGVKALANGGTVKKSADPMDRGWNPKYHAVRNFNGLALDLQIDRSLVCRLVKPAVYDCPDSLLGEAAEYTEARA